MRLKTLGYNVFNHVYNKFQSVRLGYQQVQAVGSTSFMRDQLKMYNDTDQQFFLRGQRIGMTLEKDLLVDPKPKPGSYFLRMRTRYQC